MSGVELQTVASPALTATQIETAVATVKVAVQGKSLSQVLAALPSVIESTYTLVQSFLESDQTAVSNAVLVIVTQAIGLSGLPSADVAVIDEVLTHCVPAIIALVAKYAPAVEEQVEKGCSACSKWIKGLICWHGD